jgi:hypothetical protein
VAPSIYEYKFTALAPDRQIAKSPNQLLARYFIWIARCNDQSQISNLKFQEIEAATTNLKSNMINTFPS